MELDTRLMEWGLESTDLLEGQKNFLEGARFVVENILEARLCELKESTGTKETIGSALERQLQVETISKIHEEAEEQLFLYMVFCCFKNREERS